MSMSQMSVSLRAYANAKPQASFIESSNYHTGFISFDVSDSDGSTPTLHMPTNAADAVAYLDALIRAACDLRNHYVEWAKSHEVALAA